MKYTVSKIITGFISYEIEASSEKEAKEKANSMDIDFSDFQITDSYIQVE